MDDEATRNKLEELRRDQLVEMIASVGFDMPGANGEPPLSRDRIRFAVDLGTMVAKDAAKALENRTNMVDDELRALVMSIALKELEAFAQSGLAQMRRQAEEQLTSRPAKARATATPARSTARRRAKATSRTTLWPRSSKPWASRSRAAGTALRGCAARPPRASRIDHRGLGRDRC